MDYSNRNFGSRRGTPMMRIAPSIGSSALSASEPTDGAAYSPDNRCVTAPAIWLRRAHPGR
jgi:hypothetical protein